MTSVWGRAEKDWGLGFEIIDIRRFEPKDFSNLLDAEGRVWDEKMRWDFAASTRVITSCLRDKRLSGYALVDRAKIQGYCFFFYDGEKGIIGDLFIHPDLNSLGHERELLEHSLETLQATPGLRRIEAQLPHFKVEELESCFHPHHFKAYLRRFMALALETRPQVATDSGDQPSAQKAWWQQSIELIPWDKRLHDEAADLLYQSYRRHVDAMINDQYTSVMGTTRLVDNIFQNQGCGDFLAHISRMAIHRPTHQLAGILTVTRVRPRTAHIPQVGVGKSFQGVGIGTAMMEAAFRDLAQAGFQEVTLTVTDANSGAVRLYHRLGFETFKAFGAFIFDRDSHARPGE